VCALHKQCAPAEKVLKKFKNTNKLYINTIWQVYFFQRVSRPDEHPFGREVSRTSSGQALMRRGNPAFCGTGCPEALASRKVVYREVCTEGYLRLIKEQIKLQNPIPANRKGI